MTTTIQQQGQPPFSLSQQNPHPRDIHIHFEEGSHTYTIQGVDGITPETVFTSVTTLVHQQFEQFDAKKMIAAMMRNQKKWNDPVANAKYYGKTAKEIEQSWATAGQEAATAGTQMHYKIECFYNNIRSPLDDAATPEFAYFLKFNEEHVACEGAILRPYRTEWTVFHEEARIAGSIDMVYELTEHPDTLVIYDWKRCREITKTNRAGKFATHPAIEHIPDANYWHYALQLNIYKYILQTKYGKTVTDLYLIVLHPDAQNYQQIKLPDLQTEVAELFEERIKKLNTPRSM
jgi:ATP-dependent exoDNAse (exonuclease V) beta subunit